MLGFKFLHVPQKNINPEKIIEIVGVAPRKICFNSCHTTALKKKEYKEFIGTFSLPFRETIKSFFEQETGLTLYETKYGYWHPIPDEDVYIKIEQFINKYREIVFIRDYLELSIALSENFNDQNERTEIGELEYQAKFKKDEASIDRLIEKCIESFKSLPFYIVADLICAIPPSKKDEDNLPRIIASNLEQFGLGNISKCVSWAKEKPQLKEMKFDEKFNLLESVGLEIKVDVKDKVIVLIDDLYQSGITMQYVAMKLKEAGAKMVFGLSIVKSRKNTDNS